MHPTRTRLRFSRSRNSKTRLAAHIYSTPTRAIRRENSTRRKHSRRRSPFPSPPTHSRPQCNRRCLYLLGGRACINFFTAATTSRGFRPARKTFPASSPRKAANYARLSLEADAPVSVLRVNSNTASPRRIPMRTSTPQTRHELRTQPSHPFRKRSRSPLHSPLDLKASAFQQAAASPFFFRRRRTFARPHRQRPRRRRRPRQHPPFHPRPFTPPNPKSLRAEASPAAVAQLRDFPPPIARSLPAYNFVQSQRPPTNLSFRPEWNRVFAFFSDSLLGIGRVHEGELSLSSIFTQSGLSDKIDNNAD